MLLIRYPGYTTVNELADFMFGDDPEGGSDNARAYISNRIDILRFGYHYRRTHKTHQNDALSNWLGLEIKANYGRGFTIEFTERAPTAIEEAA